MAIIVIASATVFAINAENPCTFSVCSAAVKNVTISSAFLYGGFAGFSSNPMKLASLWISLDDPGAATYITSITLSGWTKAEGANGNTSQVMITTSTSNTSIVITNWQTNSKSTNTIDFSVQSPANAIATSTVSHFIYFPRMDPPLNITTGQMWSFVIDLANGQSESGWVFVQ
ncbi:MAG: hypothetical protein OK439_00130 [Thaumarchaeota archaeon]|nr:hypothetical protein [Nitrososphaerota archaeon]